MKFNLLMGLLKCKGPVERLAVRKIVNSWFIFNNLIWSPMLFTDFKWYYVVCSSVSTIFQILFNKAIK